jgi:DNA-binding transcriptional regulator LsrR (DeoR family)
MELDAIMQQIKALYLEGLTRKKIAKTLGLDDQKVGYLLYTKMKLHELYPRKLMDENIFQILTDHQISRILTLATYGYDCREIAEDQNLEFRKVKKLLDVAQAKNMIEKKV